jgi:hypothetical protein
LSKKILEGKISPESIMGVTLDAHNNIEFLNLDEVKV